MSSPLLFVGLGNPGKRYERTPHNVGFHVIDILADVHGVDLRKPVFGSYLIGMFRLDGRRIYLCKPLCYMNKSGEVLPEIMRRTGVKAPDIVVVTDNIDLPVGSTRLKKSSGSEPSHNGLRSINEFVPKDQYLRMFIGIASIPDMQTKQGLAHYVLTKWPENADERFQEVFERTAGALVKLPNTPIQQIMSSLNEKKPR